MPGGLNFLGSSTDVMDSKKGVSEIVPTLLFRIGSLAPGMLEGTASLNSSISFRMEVRTCWEGSAGAELWLILGI